MGKFSDVMKSGVLGLGTAALGASKLFAEGGAVGDRPAGLAELAIYNMA